MTQSSGNSKEDGLIPVPITPPSPVKPTAVVTGQAQYALQDGVEGTSVYARGVYGASQGSEGVYGISHSAQCAGVLGANDNTQGNAGAGVWGESQGFDGVHGISHSPQHAGVSGANDKGGIGVYGHGDCAGYFEGNVQINGTITIASGGDVVFADFSEEFDVTMTPDTEPGTVMVFNQQGMLQPSQQAYDKKVAGVISGAGHYQPGLILDRKDSSVGRLPIALVGKAYCKVDAQYAPIEVGDLLTTSSTPGYAMKALEPDKAFGSVIGKALRPLATGQELIPILIALQ